MVNLTKASADTARNAAGEYDARPVTTEIWATYNAACRTHSASYAREVLARLPKSAHRFVKAVA